MTRSARGFTLIELLVVIAILAILTVIGIVVFKGVSEGARDSRRKADVGAISKAYENKYLQSGIYQPLQGSDFASESTPKDPNGEDYYNNLSSDNDSFRVCAALEGNSSRTCSAPSANCYCLSSAQGAYVSGGGSSGIDHPSSCDPDGTLGYGLVGYWKIDETAADTCSDEVSDNCDSSGNILDGEWNGNVTSSSGKFGNGVVLGGMDDFVRVIHSHILQPTSGTVSAWVKGTSFGSNGTVVAKWIDNGLGVYGYRMVILSDGKLQFSIANGFPDLDSAISSTTLNPGAWYHVVGSWRAGAGVSVYVNGNLRGGPTGTRTVAYSGASYLNIGRDYDLNPQDFNGMIDDVRVYTRALSGPEISTLYNNGNGCVP